MLKKVVLSLLLFTLSLPAFADTCSNVAYSPSSSDDRTTLLEIVKEELVSRSTQSERQLQAIIQGIQGCQDAVCVEWLDSVIQAVRVQYKTAKISQAIAESRYNFFTRTQGPRTISQMAQRIQNNIVRPEQIANFDFNNVNFTDADKAVALESWKRIFAVYATSSEISNLREALDATKTYFKRIAQGLIQTNVLLAVINNENQINKDGIVHALQQIRAFNQDFYLNFQGMFGFRTYHSDALWTNFAILMPDHEMGLVSFTNVIDDVIRGMNGEERPVACNAFSDLQRQQTRRVLTSIGVGFGTAVLCGVGVWSGVGTAPAVAMCIPNMVDGIVGGSRGILNALVSRNSFYAGRDFSGDILDTEGIVSYADSQVGQRRNQFIAAVNFLGLIPTGKALLLVRAREAAEAARAASILAETGEVAARSAARGTIVDLVKLPATDISVSVTESQAYAVAIAIMLVRGVELAEIDLDALLAIALRRDR